VAKKFKKKMYVTYFAKFIGGMELASRAEALCCYTMACSSFCVVATSETHFFGHNVVNTAVLVVAVKQSDREISALCS
jgi:L-fucose mutarotase/ribose pyranase (RbsD/FucU family)